MKKAKITIRNYRTKLLNYAVKNGDAILAFRVKCATVNQLNEWFSQGYLFAVI